MGFFGGGRSQKLSLILSGHHLGVTNLDQPECVFILKIPEHYSIPLHNHEWIPCFRRPFRWWGVGPLPKRWNITGSYSCLGSHILEKLWFFGWKNNSKHYQQKEISMPTCLVLLVVCDIWLNKISVKWPIPYHTMGGLYCIFTLDENHTKSTLHVGELHPGRLTWNLHITHLARKMIWTKPPKVYVPAVHLQECIPVPWITWDINHHPFTELQPFFGPPLKKPRCIGSATWQKMIQNANVRQRSTKKEGTTPRWAPDRSLYMEWNNCYDNRFLKGWMVDSPSLPQCSLRFPNLP